MVNMNNKNLIALALRETPSEFQETSRFLQLALQSLNKEEKQSRKNKKLKETITAEKKWQLDLKTGMMTYHETNPILIKNALNQIENMIREEEEKTKEKTTEKEQVIMDSKFY